MNIRFDRKEAFSRNLGWITTEEQKHLSKQKVAIAGLGGVGGTYLITLTRLGIGRFAVSDFDRFELANFNRQAGASLHTLGRPKIDVMAESARDINPDLEITTFPNGIDAKNVQEFLEGVAVYVDGLDFFALEARRIVYRACENMGIPVVVAAPLGMGVSNVNYIPGCMTLSDYFGMDEDLPEIDQLLRFMIGLSPGMLQARYLADPSTVDLAAHKGPSTPMACDLCSGVACTQTLKLLLGRGKVPAAPVSLHFDAYLNRMKRIWRPGGYRNPMQRMMFSLARKRFRR